MKIDVNDIKIGKGLGDIVFGSTKESIENLLGKPAEIEIFNASEQKDGYLTEAWHYDAEEFSLSFDEEDNWRLTTISISLSESTLNGQALMGKGIDEVIELMSSEDVGAYELEDLSDDDVDQKLVSFLDASLNLWFEDGELSEIQWSVLWSDEDTPNWPK